MNCRITDLRNKDVINIKDGCKLGVVCDIEVDTVTAQVVAIIVYGKPKFFGFLGYEDDIIINWCDIQVIGEDAILVCYKGTLLRPKKKKSFVGAFFSND